MDKTDIIIVGGGRGERLGYSIPKAFVELCGKPLYIYSLETFCGYKNHGKLLFVCPEEWAETAQKQISESKISCKVDIVAGGEQRWQSVKNGCGLAESEWIMCHDAARPFVSIKVIEELAKLSDKFKCAITATPEVDTIRRFNGDTCLDTVDRDTLLRVGTPQLFLRKELMSAFDDAAHMTNPPSDEALLMENRGIEVGFTWDEPLNFKITTKYDIETARAIIAQRDKKQDQV